MSDDEPKRSDLVDIACLIVGETARAYKIDDGTRVVWLPKSLVEYDPEDKTMAMPEWLAHREGLI